MATDSYKNEILEIKEQLETIKDEIKKEMEKFKDEIECTKKEKKNNNNEMMEIINQIAKMKEENMKNKKEMKKLIEKITAAKEEKEENKKEIEQLKEELAVMKDEKEENKTEILNVNQSIEETKKKVWDLTERIETLSISTNVIVGEILFSVDRISIRKLSEEWIPSPYFYSHFKGYKLRLEVHPAGNCAGGTHLSVFFIICKGQYDDMLSWPCKHLFKVSVINQSNKEDIESMTWSYSSTGDNMKHCFHKPIHKHNEGYGYQLISHEDLQTITGGIVNDVVVIKCTATPPL